MPKFEEDGLSVKTVVHNRRRGLYLAIPLDPELDWQTAIQFMASWSHHLKIKLVAGRKSESLRTQKLKLDPNTIVFRVHVSRLADFWISLKKFLNEPLLIPSPAVAAEPI